MILLYTHWCSKAVRVLKQNGLHMARWFSLVRIIPKRRHMRNIPVDDRVCYSG